MPKEKILIFLLFLTTFIFLSSLFVFAWQEPTTNPPGGNVYAPVNVGPTSQTKSGNLTLKNLYLNATAAEGDIYKIDELVGYNDIFVKGNSSETAPVYLAGNKIYAYTNSQSRLFIDTNGNVGIGTTSPGAKLDVEGDIYWGGNNALLTSDQGGSIELGGHNGIAGVGVPYIDFHYNGISEDYNVRLINDANDRLHMMGGNFVVDGNVGIGRTNPIANLDIGSGSIGNCTDITRLILRSPEDARWEFHTRAINPGAGGCGDTFLDLKYLPPSGSFTNNLITINWTGDIGIKTTDPKARLDVDGRIHATGDICTDKGGGVCLSTAGGGGISGSGTTNYIPKWTGGTSLGNSIIYQSGSNMGIGTTNPGEKLHVAGKIKADGIIYSMSDSGYAPATELRTWGINKPDKHLYIEWGNSNDDAMYITDHWRYGSPLYVRTGPIHLMAGNKYGLFVNTNGNVGIGTTSPSYKLQVQGGDIYSSGYVRGGTGLCIGSDCRTSWPSGGSMPGAGNGLYYSGSTLHVGAGTGISVGSDNINIRYPTYSCSSGYALRSISLINGGKSCVPVGGGSGGFTTVTYASCNNSTSYNTRVSCVAKCPSGYTLIGCSGTFGATYSTSLRSTEAYPRTYENSCLCETTVQEYNKSPYVYCYAFCIK